MLGDEKDSMLKHRWTTVEGLSTHYVIGGSGPPLLLLHGLGASHAVWQENLGPLAERYTVLAPDLPGHGASEVPRVPFALSEAVRWVAGFLETAGVPRAVALVGNSLGGLLALRAAAAFPALTESVVLVASVGLGRTLPLPLRLMTLPLLGELFLYPWPGRARLVLRVVFADPKAIPVGLAEGMAQRLPEREARAAVLSAIRSAVTLRGLRRDLLSLDALRRLSAPVMVVWGDEDRILPVAHAKAAIQGLPAARLEILSRCGHWPQMERPEAFASLLVDFLTQVRAPKARVPS